MISQVVLAISDFFAFNLGAVCALLFVTLCLGNIDNYIPKNEQHTRIYAHMFLSVVCVAWFWVRLRHYTYRKPFWFELKEILRTVLIFAVIDLVIIALSKWGMSRYVWFVTWTSVAVLLPVLRFSTKNILRKLKIWNKQCVIIGTGANALETLYALRSEESLGFDVQYFFAVDTTDVSQNAIEGIPILFDEDCLWAETSRRHTQYIIALEDGQGKIRAHWLKILAMRMCRAVSVVPTTRGLPLNSTDMSFIFKHEILLLRINNNLTKKSARFIKRSFDLLVASSILLLISPVFIALSLMVKKDGGPAIYGHTRIGRDGQPFKCLKFRSMVTNSKEVLDELLATNIEARAEWEKDFKLKNDPRITKVGYFLRKSSLDELPQLLNVIKGEMSLVGPRPVIQEEVERYGEHKEYYLMAKPGMTGLWQVSGRNDVDYETRVYFDAWYVKNWSLWNDVAILFKTVNVVLKRDGAY
ncbi:undecaprenyl-phosphate galactose phosphotransferase WbaP [Pelistega sp. MC2]|uniref:undecaprenyl-phosphate galactose phosphotransferase WbaP n=1 Tax=Pelistega sp. MC2 TaxID=1720297 RepID=UPI00115F812D